MGREARATIESSRLSGNQFGFGCTDLKALWFIKGLSSWPLIIFGSRLHQVDKGSWLPAGHHQHGSGECPLTPWR
ncbi:hypothetical protein NPIL_146301 [Nephila pilipes]|uniref:Uncharacterized protein n=1 Tax=Nephila pilipes TaxID=299642 RepID=A0A8X6Q8C6_NEPPI|nr:hypothetical protein NPIL_146301 [Nephila pilipes]